MAKILIVDDEDRVRKLYGDILSAEGFEVLLADNGLDCMRLAVEEYPDLILLDLIMPPPDGAETAQRLLENDDTKNIPIIFLTSAITAEESQVETGQIGGRLFMSKSLRIGEVIKMVRKVLDAKHR
ncbi:MAG: response regulator [Candidatus Omnitrophica bacterium]|nr:response regulator [Candidatus Omnitrophota bacterium]